MHIAHINENGTIQTCTEHCRNTALLSQAHLKDIDLGTAAFLAGLLHDCGKFTTDFSEYITESVKTGQRTKQIIHTFAGVSYLLNSCHTPKLDFDDVTAEMLAVAVASHHGLIDVIDEDGISGFEHRLTKQPAYDKKAIENFLLECADEKELSALFADAFSEVKKKVEPLMQIAKDNDELYFYISQLTRLLSSAVISGDREDTASFMNNRELPQRDDSNTLFWKNRLASVESYIAGFSNDSPLFGARRAMSDICRERAASPGRIYRLNMPTGAGKTLSALRFSLAHAAAFGKKHIFYIAPLLSIIDQNAMVIREAMGSDEGILEHHSDVVNDMRANRSDDSLDNYELLCETWNAPVIITTLVRVLDTMFGAKTSDVRRFCELSDSVLIFDEIQSLPGNMLSIFNMTLNFLSTACNCTIVLCSATQPAFEEACHPVLPAEDLIPAGTLRKFLPLFKRTDISDGGLVRLEEIPDVIGELIEKYDSVLVVCNTKSEAASVFRNTKIENVHICHLSAGMCMTHRKKTLESLIEDLEQHNKVICVATQVIEAGIDISFAAVIRVCAGLDSIVQAAGRCNRHAEIPGAAPVTVLHVADERLGALKSIEDGQNAYNALHAEFVRHPGQFEKDLASDKSIAFYYRMLFKNMKQDAQDYPIRQKPTMFSLLSQNTVYLERYGKSQFFMTQAFKTAAKAFSVFADDTVTVIVPYEEGEDIISELLSAQAQYNPAYKMELLRRAGAFSVSIYQNQLKKLSEAGAIKPIAEDGVYLLYPEYYDKNLGVITEKKEEGELCETLIL